MPFSIQNYVDAARHLQLDSGQLLPGSYLRSQFTKLENIDVQLDEDIKVAYVQDLLINLNNLESQLDSDRTTNETLGVKTFKVDQAYTLTFADDQSLGLLSGIKQQYDKYLVELKRELGYNFETDFNKQVGALIV